MLFSRLDLHPIHRKRLVSCAQVIWRADRDPLARSKPPAFIMGVEKGLPQVADQELFIEACETVEGIEDGYAGEI